MLKSLLSTFTHTQNAPKVLRISQVKLSRKNNHNICLAVFSGHSLGTWKNWLVFSSFNPFPSLPSVATDDRKQFQCCNIVFGNKTTPLFLGFQWCEDYLFSCYDSLGVSLWPKEVITHSLLWFVLYSVYYQSAPCSLLCWNWTVYKLTLCTRCIVSGCYARNWNKKRPQYATKSCERFFVPNLSSEDCKLENFRS